MKIFVFDTETTGFINKKDFNLENQPHIIQFAGILGDLNNGKFTEEKRINQLINPKEPIPYSSSEIHHIYDIDVKKAPYIEDVIDNILYYINTPDIIIGHNIEFDEEMIKLELKRINKLYKYIPKQTICTMKTTVDFCKIEGLSKRYKYPKLSELYKKLFGEYFSGAHDAIVDVEATLKCFIELVNKEIIKVKDTKEEIISLF